MQKEQIIVNRKTAKIVFRSLSIRRTKKAWEDLKRAKVLSWYEIPMETSNV